jgi:DNA-binding MarR family transcriptional regulator
MLQNALFRENDPFPSPAELSPAEQAIYRALYDAAEAGQVCPNYLDLNEVAGFESSSASPGVVKRLEAKGLIAVVRYQRFREVQIVATGKWTARSRAMHKDNPHVPRGTRSRGPRPTDRKPYKSRGN